ncbi:hypothetical protein L479_00899 [Exiguobacterium sp. S17]|nr:hypothetical protein L479_00899 [Exiguobacterium sp. S17]
MKQIVKDYIYLLTGSVFVASAFSLFLFPNNIASGGVSGISIITYELFGISPGAFQLVVNVLLLLIGWMILGLGFGVKSLVGSIFLPGVILFYESIGAGAVVDDTLLAAVFGGVGIGIGLGLIFRGRASTGGMDLLAQILHKFTHIPLYLCIAILDGAVVVVAAVTFSFTTGLYALIALYITIKMIDFVQLGFTQDKMAYVISDKRDVITRTIFDELDRGATEIQAIGAYSRLDRPMLLVVVRQNEVSRLRDLIRRIDPDAFLVFSEAHEVMGQGFTSDKRYSNVP